MERAFSIRNHVRSIADEDGAVLLDTRRGKYFSLNPIAVEIWRKIEEGATRAEIETHLRDTYDAPAAVLHEHCERFLDHLRRAELVDVSG